MNRDNKAECLGTRFLDVLQSRQSVDRVSRFLLRHPQFIETLQVKPELGCRSKEMRESKGGVTRDRSPAVQNFRDTIGRDIELPSEFGGAHAQFFQLLCKMLTRVNCLNCHCVLF